MPVGNRQDLILCALLLSPTLSLLPPQLSSGVHTHHGDGSLPIYLRMAADRAQGAGAFWQALCRMGPLIALLLALL